MTKLGRPRKTEQRQGMRNISFHLDDETLYKLEELEAKEGPNIRGRRSNFLRKLICDAFERSKK
jgi:hypothetical protein